MFDPYHKWLGIRKDQRPPTHYQLLGISPDETDLEVIEEAAIRQMAHIRTYQIGPHAKECTQVLNEISQARTTLLNAGKRKEYDARLAANVAATLAQQQPIAAQEVAAQISATPPALGVAGALEFSGFGDRPDEVVAPPRRSSEGKAMPSIAKEGVFLTRPMLLGIIGGGAVLAVLAVVILVVVVFGLSWWGLRPPAGPVAVARADKKDGKDRDGKVKPADGPAVVAKDDKEKIVVNDADKGNLKGKEDLNPKPPINVPPKDAGIALPKINPKPRPNAPMGFEEEVTQAGELKIRQLARAAYGAPVWDADGKHFYFSARTTELFKLRADDDTVVAYNNSLKPHYFYVSLATSSEGLLGLSKRIGAVVEGAVLVLLDPATLKEKRNVVVTATKCQPLLVASAPASHIAVVCTTDGLYVVNVKTSDVSIPVNLPMKLFNTAAYITPDGKYFFGTEGTALVRCRIEGDKLIHEETSKLLNIQPGSILRIEGSVDGKRVWLARAVEFRNPVSHSVEIFDVDDLSKSVMTVAGETSFYSLMLSPRDGTPYGSLKESPLVRFTGLGKVNQTFTIKLDEPRQIYASPSGEGFLVRGRDSLFHAAFANVGVGAVEPPGAIDVAFELGGR